MISYANGNDKTYFVTEEMFPQVLTKATNIRYVKILKTEKMWKINVVKYQVKFKVFSFSSSIVCSLYHHLLNLKQHCDVVFILSEEP